MDIRVLHQLEGAKAAAGLTVIIDVFRAFTVECFLSQMKVKEIFPVKDVKECFALKDRHPDYFLVGERNGVKVPGFDAGNSPMEITTGPDLEGRSVVHTTSAGVQGIAGASHASEVIVASLVNARAVARYIKQKDPQVVSLVAMGLNGVEDTDEDLLCATYIRDLLEGKHPNIHQQIRQIQFTSGRKFFVRRADGAFPEPDFFMCLVPDMFDFVLTVDRSSYPYRMVRIDC
ncbi:MAG: 2-phosphosulfolactate phosphatase [Sphaerochaetaceae bacterium]|nr:2-phosphosulfolactate phosphatase [Spirochaetales bacterium]MDY5498578.1 2-phosphosulfolactate phosphatase [Sphaerochaetaceae bacterium]